MLFIIFMFLSFTHAYKTPVNCLINKGSKQTCTFKINKNFTKWTLYQCPTDTDTFCDGYLSKDTFGGTCVYPNNCQCTGEFYRKDLPVLYCNSKYGTETVDCSYKNEYLSKKSE